MSWMSIAILAYLILGVASLTDKYLLSGPIPSPRTYAFYVGLLGVATLLLVPFTGFSLPGLPYVLLALFSGACFIGGVFWLSRALRLFEASRAVPAVGAMTSLLSFGLVYAFSGGRTILSPMGIAALLLLALGSELIASEKGAAVNFKSLGISFLASLFFSLYFVLGKYVYMAAPFWHGLILIKLGGVLAAAAFLFSKKARREIFAQKISVSGGKKTAGIFVSNQAMAAGANVLQSWAIALAPLAYVPVVNALQGTQYVFLLFLAAVLSVKFPKIIREEISKEVMLRKISAILLIGAGLFFLTLR